MVVSIDYLGSVHGSAISPEGCKIGLFFLCLHSNWGYLVPLRSKSDVLTVVKQYKAFS